MKAFCSLAILALTALGGGLAADEVNRRLAVQFVEADHALITELLSGAARSGTEIRERVMAARPAGRARLLETCVLAGTPGTRLTAESVHEFGYPTEYDSDIWRWSADGAGVPEFPDFSKYLRPSSIMLPNWEIRNAGVGLEVHASNAADGSPVEAGIAVDIVLPPELQIWMEHRDAWGDAPIRLPIFETRSVNLTANLVPGEFALLAILKPPQQEPAPARIKRVLVFGRID
jgi:hypothetical protein